ncbi:MAG: hypothetical protein KIS73_29780 [Enhydrobacter sp.]|nr:hypothetical protein [Enhydrobacter sp.]
MVPYRTLVSLGLAVGMLGAGYVFAPQAGSAALPPPAVPEAAPGAADAVAAVPPTKAAPTLVANRPPVPIVTRSRDTYFVPKAADTVLAAVTPGGSSSGASSGLSTVALTVGGATDGGLPPPPEDAKPRDNSRAKAAIELDGYKNVRGLERGPDGVWRGRAMRGRTEIAIRVDDAGNVSAE